MVGKGKAKVKVGKLKVNKDTVKDLTKGEKKKVRGGLQKGNGATIVSTRLCNPPNPACGCSDL